MIKKSSKIKKIKIPKNISVLFNYTNNFVLIKGPFSNKFLKFPFHVFFIKNQRCLMFLRNSSFNNHKIKKKETFFFFLLKKKFLEVSKVLTKKLIFVGLGYRFFFLDTSIPILKLKLGYSHEIFFKPLPNLKYNFIKNTFLFLKSTDYNFLNLISSQIKSYKSPNAYKKKGIYYSKETVILKKFKKI